MSHRTRTKLAVAASLLAVPAAFAGSPKSVVPVTAVAAQATAASTADSDQKLADGIAQSLAGNPKLTGFQVDVVCENGVVELIGTAATAEGKAELIKIARYTANVKAVKDSVAVRDDVQPVQAVAPPLAMNNPGFHGGVPPAAGLIGGGMPGGPAEGFTGSFPGSGAGYGGPVGAGGPSIDPVPVGGAFDVNPPRLPPNAWPTYAPYNNYSRVGYPTEYPHSAFPFVGPFYPFPKVPLGFRAIKLEWEDGNWFYGRTATNRDWWKVRYW